MKKKMMSIAAYNPVVSERPHSSVHCGNSLDLPDCPIQFPFASSDLALASPTFVPCLFCG